MIRPRFHQESPEDSFQLRLITLAMTWLAGVALSLATSDTFVVLLLTLVISAGHWVSWRTRTWKSYRWQLMLLLPISGVGLILVPTLPGALQGDWLHPMRYLLTLQALSAYYLHSRASLYTSQLLSAIVVLVASQLAFDSTFLFFFFAFLFVALVFLAAATSRDAVVAAIGASAWPGRVRQGVAVVAVAVAVTILGVGVFMVLPWGTLQVGSASGSVLPLTGATEPAGDGDEGSAALPESLGGAPLPSVQDSILIPGREGSGGDPASPGGSIGPLDGQGTGEGRGGGLGGDVDSGIGDDREVLFAGGELEDITVMQVRSPVASYWRGQTYSALPFALSAGLGGEQWVADPPGAGFERARRSQGRQYTQTFFLREPQDTPLLGYSPLALQVVGSDSEAPGLDAGAVYRVLSERRNFHPTALSSSESPSRPGCSRGLPPRDL